MTVAGDISKPNDQMKTKIWNLLAMKYVLYRLKFIDFQKKFPYSNSTKTQNIFLKHSNFSHYIRLVIENLSFS